MFNILSLVAATNLIIFAIILLFIKSERRDSQYLLSLVFFCLSINLFEMYAIQSGYYHQYPFILKISMVSLALTGMAFYHYILSILGLRIKLALKSSLHFIPFIIALVGYIVFHSKGNAYIIDYYDTLNGELSPLEIAISVSLNVLTLAYFISTYRVLKRLKKCLMNNYSGPSQVELNWLIYFVLGLIASLMLVVTSLLFVKDETLIIRLGISIMSIVYFVSLVRTIKRPALLTDFKFISESTCTLVSYKEIIQKQSPVENDELAKTFDVLKNYIESKKAYCIPKLSLEQLATSLEVKKYILSQAINKYAKQNYFTFINTYRIEEAKSKLSDELYKDCSVESVGLSCGFNSASSFFLVFKRIVGETPTAYRKHHIELSYQV